MKLNRYTISSNPQKFAVKLSLTRAVTRDPTRRHRLKSDRDPTRPAVYYYYYYYYFNFECNLIILLLIPGTLLIIILLLWQV